MNKLKVGQYYRVVTPHSVVNRSGPAMSHRWAHLEDDSIILLLGHDGKGYIEYIYDGEFIRSWENDLEIVCLG